MLVNNYLVTYSELTTMGLFPIGSPPTGNQIATKSFITTYYNVDTSYLTGYASNQCVMYQDIVGLTIYYFNVYNVNPIDCSTTYGFPAYTVNEPHADGFYMYDGTLCYLENTTANSPTNNITYAVTPSSCTPSVTLYLIGTGAVITSNVDCTPTMPTLPMYLDATDYTKYVNNGNCLTNDGFNTVSYIRNSDGSGMVGPFYFTFGSCTTNTFLCAVDGALSINAFQCP